MKRKYKELYARDKSISQDPNAWLLNWHEKNGKKKVRVLAEVIQDQTFGYPPSAIDEDQLSPDAMSALISLKGWTIVDLASWWDMRPETLIRHIKNICRPIHIDDMVWGLTPYYEIKHGRWRKKLLGMAAGENLRQKNFQDQLPNEEKVYVSSFSRSNYGGFPGQLK